MKDNKCRVFSKPKIELFTFYRVLSKTGRYKGGLTSLEGVEDKER